MEDILADNFFRKLATELTSTKLALYEVSQHDQPSGLFNDQQQWLTLDEALDTLIKTVQNNYRTYL